MLVHAVDERVDANLAQLQQTRVLAVEFGRLWQRQPQLVERREAKLEFASVVGDVQFDVASAQTAHPVREMVLAFAADVAVREVPSADVAAHAPVVKVLAMRDINDCSCRRADVQLNEANCLPSQIVNDIRAVRPIRTLLHSTPFA